MTNYIIQIPSYKSSVLLLLLLLLWNCCTILDLCLKSEIMDGFWSSRCLNDCIDMPDKMGSFLSSATTPMVVKSGTKKYFSPKNTKNDKNRYKEHSNKKKLENRPPQKWAF